MRCPRCQHENRPHAKFCEECATPLARTCANCGTQISAAAKFCPECAHPVAGPTAGQQRFGSPQAYTPKHLAEKILTSKTALEGERKQVTVLFADLKGSMELLADRDPEEARKLLDPVLDHMMEAVHRYEGTVNQVMGDGIMALFGAPLAHEDHAVRACYAALRMQEAVKRYAQEVQRTAGVPMQIRVGLNSGEVVVRSIGSDLHMDYTAVGQTTHLAARTEQMAMPGSSLLTGDTLRLAEGYVQVRPLGPVPVKGLSEPVEVYELLGAGPVRTRLQMAAARGLTRFVGRKAEIDQLCGALEQARGGHGQVVAVVGEPGVGKSRLFHEFVHSPRTQGWLTLESGSASYGKSTPYLPVIDLLKSYCEIEDRDDTRTIRTKVTGTVLTLDETLKETVPAVLGLLEALPEDSPFGRLDPLVRRQRTLEVIKRLLLRESQVQPLLLVLEDLHWIDSETQVVLDGLVGSLPTARLLLLVNYRPEYQHPWGSKTYYTQLRLDPLPPASAEELLEALVGTDAGLAALKRMLIERTQGNPFFLEESVRTLVETEVLVGERGAYRLAKALPAIQVPPAVQAVLAARIDRLPPEEKRLLQAAAVIGEEIPFPLLQAIAEEPEEALRLRLARLQAAEFLYETTLFPDLAYTFKHALTYQVAYQGLLQDRRRALHARIVEALERLYPDRLAEHVDQLAHHAFSGEVWDKAVTYSRQAGARAIPRAACREAVTCFEQALAALAHLPDSRQTLEQAIDLRFDLRSSLYPLGELGRSLEFLREAESLSEALGDQRRLVRVSCFMTQHLWWMGAPDQAIECGQRALAVATGLGDFGLQIVANVFLGRAYQVQGDHHRAIELLRRSVDSLEGDLVRERFGLAGLPAIYLRTWLVWSLAELGEFPEAIARGGEGVRIAEALDQPLSIALACFGVGLLYLRKGDLYKAVPLLDRGLELCRVFSIRTWFVMISSSLGYAYALSGRIREGLHLLVQAMEEAESMGIRAWQSRWFTWLSEAYLLAGRPDAAIELAGRALELSRDNRERGQQAYALRHLGEIASHADPPDAEAAEDHYRQAVALAEELGMRPLAAHCHLGLGKLYQRTGKRLEARKHLTTARTMFRDMDMRFWLDKAELGMKELV